MSVSLNLGRWSSVFAVPSCIVDENIKIASEQQLKVLLFLLRNADKNYSYKEISEELSIHTDDVKDCVEFWVERNVLSNEECKLAPADSDQISQKSDDKPQASANENKKIHVVSRLTKPDIVTAAQKVSADSTLQALLSEVEIALSKPLSSGDTATIVMLYDTCGMPPEVIIMLVNYCVSVNKGNMRTIERYGVSWADEGINSIESAENKILKLKKSNQNWSRVRKIFGMDSVGSPTKKQIEYSDKWIDQWHFSDEMLRAAYETCVDNLGKLSMAYINKVLQRWKDAGICVVSDIEKLNNEKKKKSSKRSSSGASYDIDELEKIR